MSTQNYMMLLWKKSANKCYYLKFDDIQDTRDVRRKCGRDVLNSTVKGRQKLFHEAIENEIDFLRLHSYGEMQYGIRRR